MARLGEIRVQDLESIERSLMFWKGKPTASPVGMEKIRSKDKIRSHVHGHIG